MAKRVTCTQLLGESPPKTPKSTLRLPPRRISDVQRFAALQNRSLSAQCQYPIKMGVIREIEGGEL